MSKFIAVMAAVLMLAIGGAAYAGTQNNQGQNCNSQGSQNHNSQGQDQK